MVALIDLWLPILLSAVFVFIASSIIHMVIPIHQSDYQKLPAEEDLREAMRGQGVQPGEYLFPCPASVKDMSSPEHLEKLKQGPVAKKEMARRTGLSVPTVRKYLNMIEAE